MDSQKGTSKRREPKELNIQIGERCRLAREASGYTQERLSELLGVSAQFLSDAERGVTGMSVATIIRLCAILSISTDFLLLGRDSCPDNDDPLSWSSRIQRLSPKEQELLGEAANLMIRSFHLHQRET